MAGKKKYHVGLVIKDFVIVGEPIAPSHSWSVLCTCGHTFICQPGQLHKRNGCVKCNQLRNSPNSPGEVIHGRTLISYDRDSKLWWTTCTCGAIYRASPIDLRKQPNHKCRACFLFDHDQTALNKILIAYRQGARKRNYAWGLNLEQFRSLIFSCCHYCGQEPSNPGAKDIKNTVKFSGIDRVDNHLGYTLENSVSCCTICNQMKRVLSVDDWLAHITKVLNHMKKHTI